jgi:peroxiredoxin
VAQLPDLLKLQERLKEKGLVIVGVALDNADVANRDAERKLKTFAASHGINYPVVEITPQFNLDYGKVLGLKDGRIVGTNNLVAACLPSWIIIDRAGIIRGIYRSSEQEHQVISEVEALTK